WLAMRSPSTAVSSAIDFFAAGFSLAGFSLAGFASLAAAAGASGLASASTLAAGASLALVERDFARTQRALQRLVGQRARGHFLGGCGLGFNGSRRFGRQRRGFG